MLSELKEAKWLDEVMSAVAASAGCVRLIQPDGTLLYEYRLADCTATAGTHVGHEEIVKGWPGGVFDSVDTVCHCGRRLLVMPIGTGTRPDGFLGVCAVQPTASALAAGVRRLIADHLVLARSAISNWELLCRIVRTHAGLYTRTQFINAPREFYDAALAVLQEELRAHVAVYVPLNTPASTREQETFAKTLRDQPKDWMRDFAKLITTAHAYRRCPMIIYDENREHFADFTAMGVCSFLSVTIAYEKHALARLAFASLDPAHQFSFNDLAWLESVKTTLSLRIQEFRTRGFRERFLGEALHRINTPVHAILNIAERLTATEDDVSADAREWLQMLHQQALQISGLTESARTLVRLTNGARPRHMVSLPALLQKLVANLRLVDDVKAIAIALALPTDDCIVSVDPDGIYGALQGVVENAIKFSPANSQVSIALQTDETAVRIRIADQGPGIAPENRKRVFEEFVSIPVAGQSESTGLGLSIARGVIEEHGGTLQLKNEDGGEGSCFVFTLPWKGSGGVKHGE